MSNKFYNTVGMWIEGDISPAELYRGFNQAEAEYSVFADMKDTPKDDYTRRVRNLIQDAQNSGHKYHVVEMERSSKYQYTHVYGTGFAVGLSITPYDEYIKVCTLTSNYMLHNSEFVKKYVDFTKSQFNTVDKANKSQIHIIQKSDMGLSLRKYPIKQRENSGYEFEDLYNDDFLDISDRILKSLCVPASEKNSNGIILLHGIMGTGKTNYLRYLISRVNKRVIYLPPDLAPEISSPAFLSFLMEYPDSVIIIEDAENVLKTREAGGNQAVSNILNMSDGILGDALSLQVICTFNDSIENVDKALLREGRLVEIYSFTELSEEKTLNLFNKVHGEGAVPPQAKMTISQIFNSEDFVRKGSVVKKTKVGFI